MAGYTRNDTSNNIATGNIINASDLDGEFDAIQTAFDVTTGHNHDGSVGEGSPITVVGPAQDFVGGAGDFRPKADNTYDLGTAANEWKDLYVDGTGYIDTLTADAGTVGGAAITTVSNTQTLTSKTINLTSNTLVATSAQLAAALTDETGTGSVVFSASPALTGTPTAPTAAAATNTTQIATTAHVFAERTNAATLTNKTLDAPVVTGDLNVDAGTLFVDSVNNRVGVGTLAPTVQFEVAGNIRSIRNAPTFELWEADQAVDAKRWSIVGVDSALIVRALTDAGVAGGGRFQFTRSGGNAQTFQGYRDGTIRAELSPWDSHLNFSNALATIGTTTTHDLVVETNNTERVRVSSTGSVGIGTAAPATILDVNGDVTITDKIIHSGDTNTAIRFPSVDTIAFETDGAERVRISNLGVLSIGESNPGAVMNSPGIVVKASTAFTPSVLLWSTANDNTFSQLSVRKDRAGAAVQDGDNVFYIRATGYEGDSYDQLAAVTFTVDGAVSAGVVPGRIGLFTTNTSGTSVERVRVNSAGNVGIGTTAPVTPLDVNGAVVSRGVVYRNQPAQTSKAAAATLTIAELLTGIVQYTGSADTLTLPTGTLIEGGVPATFPTNMSFDFSVINTGSGAVALGTAAGLTLVGSMSVSAGASGMFRVRKTATNTYTVYRIS